MTHTKYVSLIRSKEAAAPIKSFSSIHFVHTPKEGWEGSQCRSIFAFTAFALNAVHWMQCSPHCCSLPCCYTEAMQDSQCLSYYLKLLFGQSSVRDTSSIPLWCQIIHTWTWMKNKTPFCSDNTRTAQVSKFSRGTESTSPVSFELWDTGYWHRYLLKCPWAYSPWTLPC